MPIYEYECYICKKIWNKLQKMSEDPIRNCEECNKDSLERVMSKSSFVLKGNGWYQTDFKDKK